MKLRQCPTMPYPFSQNLSESATVGFELLLTLQKKLNFKNLPLRHQFEDDIAESTVGKHVPGV